MIGEHLGGGGALRWWGSTRVVEEHSGDGVHLDDGEHSVTEVVV